MSERFLHHMKKERENEEKEEEINYINGVNHRLNTYLCVQHAAVDNAMRFNALFC